MKKSDIVKQQLKACKEEYERLVRQEVYENPERTSENHNKLWYKFWEVHGDRLSQKEKELEAEYYKELNREIGVGDGVTMYLYSDRKAYTVIAKTAKTITIQRDKAIRDPGFKPEWIPGGFSAICTNCEDQKWTYERDPNGEVVRCRWSEKHGRYQTGSDGSIAIGRGRHEYYDYNF